MNSWKRMKKVLNFDFIFSVHGALVALDDAFDETQMALVLQIPSQNVQVWNLSVLILSKSLFFDIGSTNSWQRISRFDVKRNGKETGWGDW